MSSVASTPHELLVTSSVWAVYRQIYTKNKRLQQLIIYLIPLFDLENADISASNGQISSWLVESNVADIKRVRKRYRLEKLELSQVPDANFVVARGCSKMITVFWKAHALHWAGMTLEGRSGGLCFIRLKFFSKIEEIRKTYVWRWLQIPNFNFCATRSSSENETVRMELSSGNAVFVVNANNVSFGENVGESPRFVVAWRKDVVLSRVEWKRRDRVFVNFELGRSDFFFIFVVPNTNRAVVWSRNGNRTILMKRDGSDGFRVALNRSWSWVIVLKSVPLHWAIISSCSRLNRTTVLSFPPVAMMPVRRCVSKHVIPLLFVSKK